MRLLAFQLKLPGQGAGDQHWEQRERGTGEVVVGRFSHGYASGPSSEEPEQNCEDIEGDGEVDKRNMLSVFGQNHGFRIKGIDWSFHGRGILGP